MTVPSSEESIRYKRSVDELSDDELAFNPMNGLSVNDYMSQKLDRKRRRMMTQNNGGSSSESESGSGSESDSDGEDDIDVDTSPARAGVIEKITLKNFMCHDSFELNLGPQLNFIIGRNGSGKSAILTGISVGLGAKAADTSRGSSIKDLIKDGKEMAKVSIVFKNEGDEAFRSEEYGKKIIVERTIKKVGTNSYFIKSENLKTISTKKSTIDEILYKFNITIDNPLAFLSQDRAREFLSQSTDQAKYDYFMTGSLIHDILENYRITSKNIVEVQDKLKQARSHFEAADKKYKASAALYNKFKKSDYLRRKLEIIHGKAYWYNVTVVEKKIHDYKKEVLRAEDDIRKIDQEIENVSKSLENTDEEKKLLEDKQENATIAVTKLRKEFDNIKEKRDEAKSMRKQLEEEIEKLQKENSELEKLINKNEMEIAKEQKHIDDENGGSKEVLSENLDKLNTQIESLNNEREEIRVKLSDFNFSGNPELVQTENEIRNSEETIASLKQKKAHLQESRKDKFAPWGREMNNIINCIKDINSWHEGPIGPIGSYVEVKTEYSRWKDLINTVLGKTLDSFLVCDEHDRKILDGIFKKFKVNKNIIIRKLEKFNYEHGKVQNQTTFLDMLTIGNETVFYTLVDTNNIEKNIIAEDRYDANKLVTQYNVMSVFSLLGKRSGNRASSGDNGSFRIDPIHYRDELHKFSSGSGPTAKDIEEIDNQIDVELENISKLKRKFRDIKMKLQTQKENLEKRNRLILQQIKVLSNEIFKIENKLNENGDLSKIENLKSQIVNHQEQITINLGVISSLREDRDKERAKSLALKEDLEKAREAVTQAVHDLENTRIELETFSNDLVTLQENKIHYEVTKDRRLTSIKNAEDKILQGESKLAPILATAESKCKREEANVDLNRDTSDSISKEYQDVQRQVKEAEASLGRSYEDIQQELLDNKQKREDAEKNVIHLDHIYRRLDSELNIRFNYLHTTILKNIGEASSSFERSLALRGFKGELKFSFTNKTLVLLAQTKNDEEKRTVDSLSGGEKSFAQIALLLAIWKVMDSKVRGLDEFDVYMDSVNRSISIKLLLAELRQYPKSQSIFITPQDIAAVGDLQSDDVRIHKMSDPRKDN